MGTGLVRKWVSEKKRSGLTRQNATVLTRRYIRDILTYYNATASPLRDFALRTVECSIMNPQEIPS